MRGRVSFLGMEGMVTVTSPPGAASTAPLAVPGAQEPGAGSPSVPPGPAPGLRPILLDLFCGAGGAARGYQQAGFYVVGVDIVDQPRYAGDEFHRENAMRVLEHLGRHWAGRGEGWTLGHRIDAIAAGPPCQDYSRMSHQAATRGRLISPVREFVTTIGLPWVIENVEGSELATQDDLFGSNGLLLCGAMFGLELYRHRLFETSFPVAQPHHPRHLVPASAAGHWKPGTYVSVAGNCAPMGKVRAAMGGVDWMTRDELVESIPPPFAEFLGTRLLEHLRERAA